MAHLMADGRPCGLPDGHKKRGHESAEVRARVITKWAETRRIRRRSDVDFRRNESKSRKKYQSQNRLKISQYQVFYNAKKAEERIVW